MANHPVTYQWKFNGNDIISDSAIIILFPTAGDYGVYELTATDDMGCVGTISKNVQPIQEVYFSCISSINLSVSQNCQLNLSPSMFTNEDISGIEDYILEVTDLHGNEVDLMDLSSLVDNPTLEVKIINPCTEGIICWSHVNLEFKIFPTFDHYRDSLFASCAQIPVSDPTTTIAGYNYTAEDVILSAAEYELLMTDEKCLLQWSILADDQYLLEKDVCSSNIIGRIYLATNGDQTVALDTAILKIEALNVDSIHFPEDISNISCHTDIDAQSLSSVPYYRDGLTNFPFDISGETSNQKEGHPFCNIVLSYSDVVIGEVCEYGARKIRREWLALDWCTGKMRTETQFLFIKDDDEPYVSISIDTLKLSPDDFACFTEVDLAPYIDIQDNCDSEPEIYFQVDGFTHTDLLLKQVPVGIHEVKAQIIDECDNIKEFNFVLDVEDKTPPVAILVEHLTMTYDPAFGQHQVWLYANELDAGSHDFGCGPVEFVCHTSGKNVYRFRFTDCTCLDGRSGLIKIDRDAASSREAKEGPMAWCIIQMRRLVCI